ncbi:MAG: substrate-binding domain-containing protein [Acutalibacteraceae bacterium]
MKKRILAMLAAALIGCGALAGCSTATNQGTATQDGGSFDAARNITVVTREEGSGTRDAFVELTGVLVKDDAGNKTDNTSKEAVVIDGTQAVISNVAGNPYAIGYISLGSMNDTVKAVKVNGVEATAANVKSASYELARPFNIATKSDLSEVAKDFVDFILSADGQKVVEDNGYVAVSENAAYSGSKPSGKVTVAGSSSVSPVMEKLKEAYEAINTNATVEIQTTDSSAGMTAAKEGTCDIGMASRELKSSESEVLTSTKIAMDGIAVIVNKDNTADALTTEQIKNIFTGEAATWSAALA